MLPKSNAAGLHVRYEKAGLVLDALPIPWNADAAIVEANVNPPVSVALEKQQFSLKLGDRSTIAEVILRPKTKGPARVFFRVPVPARSCSAEVSWRDHLLGKVEIPIIARDDFVRGVALRLASAHIGIKGGRTAPCLAFVSGQAQTLAANAVVETPGPLAPLADLDLHVNVSRHGNLIGNLPLVLTSEQMRARQAILSAMLPKLRLQGDYAISWCVGSVVLHTLRLRLVAKRAFLQSLRISATRFIVEKKDGAVEVMRWLPQRDGKVVLDDLVRVAPCFYVCSSIAGMAGLAGLTLRAVGADSNRLLGSADVLVTDGPTPYLPVTLAADELGRVRHFTLETSAGPLGNLPLIATPQADFTAEGGMAPLDDFVWSAAAEEQLNERLGKLLGGE
ncbi:MAG TPA: hypothetical protein VFE62_21830 [Gemmataceae bacterium]|nr:hypothetical protein [Gemmataceae bacterium]